MSASDLNDQLQQAVALAQAGQRTEARVLLERIVAANPNLEAAWLWLASVATDREERIAFLERALALNPDNATTQQAYFRLTGQPYVPAAPAPIPGVAAVEERKPLLSVGNLIILMAVASVAVVAILLAISLRNDDDTPEQPVIPPVIFVTETPSETPLYSPTPSDTPRPTRTPGPSPTSVWDAPLPTWTTGPEPSSQPTRTLVPTWTPRPTQTPPPTPLPPTATFTPLAGADESGGERPVTESAPPPAEATELATEAVEPTS
ncbi:MAG: hypothetical protein GXY36_00525 [Chloroflexi bacterium]|nr:hypothetical protein [Chloroflexota bacterium]